LQNFVVFDSLNRLRLLALSLLFSVVLTTHSIHPCNVQNSYVHRFMAVLVLSRL